MEDKHYVCPGGCQGVSDTPGLCQAPDCPSYGEALLECSCSDGKHEGVVNQE